MSSHPSQMTGAILPGNWTVEMNSFDVPQPGHRQVLIEIAAELDLHPTTLCVKWAIQRGQVPIPFSTTPRNDLANMEAALSPPLSDQQMQRIASVDRQCCLIKGQVFLWKDNQSSEDLRDGDGVIRT